MGDNNHTRILIPAFDINRSMYGLAEQIFGDYQAKDVERKAEVPVDYIGISVPNKFVVGCGLDFYGKYRNKRNLLELLQKPDGK